MSSNITIPPIYVLSDNNYEMLRLKKDVAVQFIQNVKGILQGEDINFTEDLSNSLALVIIGSDVSVETNSPYAYPVEFGLPPGQFINFDALSDWVRIKLNVPDEEVEGVTWKILRKIQRDGIKPKRFWKRSILRLVKQHGVHSPRTNRKKRSKFTKIMSKLKKVVNKIRKVARFISKNTAKGGKAKY